VKRQRRARPAGARAAAVSAPVVALPEAAWTRATRVVALTVGLSVAR